MRRSELFCDTLRQNPADSDAAGHQLLIRGGYVQPLAAGIFSFLPLGQRVKSKVERLLRNEMWAIDGQEISMPVVQPAELWQETRRWYEIGSELVRFKDRGDRARPDELGAAGIVPGYASPIGVTGTTIIVDDLVAASPNLVAGANKIGFHLRHTNVPRDYRPDSVADIASAFEGASCIRCSGTVRIVRGVEVGNIFKLGTKYSKAMGATFLDENGRSEHIVMGSYGIGLERLIGCLAEACSDERGIAWPLSVAPYEVYLVGLDLADEDVKIAAENLYQDLNRAGVEVLYDDRDERAGVKFNDADLLGMPVRLTVSRRTHALDTVEFKLRAETESRHVPRLEAVAEITRTLELLRDSLASRVVSETLPEKT